MIVRSEMFAPLLIADPSFSAQWKEFCEEWSGEPELPWYLLLADFARHLIGRLELAETDRFASIFDVVERWIVEGDKYVRDAAVIGLLEALQNTNLHPGSTRPDDFERWLQPRSRVYWDKVILFWSEGRIITDD
jgi:hypothetical protein